MSLKNIMTLLAIVASTGCASGGGVRERLDERTGMTWAVADVPAVYARTDPRYSRAARDYLYFGPLETNVRGVREYFLWVGVASTIDRGYLAPERAVPVRVTFLIGDEPVNLELRPWAEVAENFGPTRIYRTAVRPRVELGARVTKDLLLRLRAASPDRISVATETGGEDAYIAWQVLPGWDGFFAGIPAP